ncbi:MAG: glycosyltransferase family 4 protein [Ignavibacteriaceae bacterium]|nr:glycosyltransferase family 4 protein [Ignavibacteriaceae bacterium]
MKNNILYISPNFNYACGVSKHVFTLLTSEELKKEFNLHFVTNGGDALQKLDKAGSVYSLMEFNTDKIFHLDLLKNLKWLEKYCKEKEIDIIHSHHRYPAYLARWISKPASIKTVVTAHNFVRRFKSFSYRADKIIAVSQSVKNHLCNYFNITMDKIYVQYNCLKGVSKYKTSQSDLRNTLKIPTSNKIIFFAGRIIEEKGIRTLANAFKILSEELSRIELVLIGENNIPGGVLKKISGKNNIHLLPPQEKIIEFYELADVVVLPSIQEPLGYIMLEAGLYKVPFVGGRAGGIDEFIDDGINGYLFEPGDAIDLANKIKYIFNHPKETSMVADKLYEKVSRECNCDKYFKKLIDIYSGLLIN